jgi:hypothetical protein
LAVKKQRVIGAAADRKVISPGIAIGDSQKATREMASPMQRRKTSSVAAAIVDDLAAFSIDGPCFCILAFGLPPSAPCDILYPTLCGAHCMFRIAQIRPRTLK